MKMRLWSAFGAKSRPDRLQVALGTIYRYTLGVLFGQLVASRVSFGTQENRTSVQNRAFEHRLALSPSKNCLWKGVRKKHSISMINRCGNQLILKNTHRKYNIKLSIVSNGFKQHIRHANSG